MKTFLANLLLTVAVMGCAGPSSETFPPVEYDSYLAPSQPAATQVAQLTEP